MKSRQVATRLTGHLEVSTDLGAFLGDTRVRLLEAIDEHGSISQAAKHVPISYKTAWDAVDAMNNLADQPLVDSSTGGRAGGGTRLTDYGRRVIAMYRAVEAEYQAALDRLASQFERAPVGDVRAFQRLLRRMSVRTSARNQYVGTVSGLREGPVDYEVRIRLDDCGRQLCRAAGPDRRSFTAATGHVAQGLGRAHRQVLHADHQRRAVRGADRGRRRDAEEADRRRPCRGRQQLHLRHRQAGAVERPARPSSTTRARCWPAASSSKLAIANPKLAPYGAAALQVLKARGLTDAVAPQAGHRREHRAGLPVRVHRQCRTRLRRAVAGGGAGQAGHGSHVARAARPVRRDPPGRGAAEGRRRRTPRPPACWPT
jgi:molybdate transport system regulatory protein